MNSHKQVPYASKLLVSPSPLRRTLMQWIQTGMLDHPNQSVLYIRYNMHIFVNILFLSEDIPQY